MAYIFQEGFEFSSFTNPPWQLSSGDGCCSHSRTTSTEWKNSGTKSFKSLIKQSDTSYRAEIVYRPTLPIGSENWLGFVIKLGAGHTKQFASLFQFHQPATGTWPPPPFFTFTRGNQLMLRRHYLSTTGSADQEWNLGTIADGNVFQLAYHIKGSYNSDGFLRVYRNGVKLVDYSGVTQANRPNGYYLKWGNYIGSGKRALSDLITYYDDIKITDANGSLADVTSYTP